MRFALKTLTALAILAVVAVSIGCSQNGSRSTGTVDSPSGNGAHLYTNTDYGFSIEYVDPLGKTEGPADDPSVFSIAFLMPRVGQGDANDPAEGVSVFSYDADLQLEPGSPEAVTFVSDLVKSVTSRGGSVVAGPKPVEIDGHEAQQVEFLFEQNGAPTHSTMTLVFAGERTYMLTAVASRGNWQEYQPFFVPTVNSFKTL